MSLNLNKPIRNINYGEFLTELNYSKVDRVLRIRI
jgi:hypothetical protein